MPKVSVIIPNYNHARFLDRRISSVIEQTFQDIEIIFLDDCSTDRSKEVFAKYSNNPKFTHAIFNESNSNSTFKQWNKGFSLAAGEYIWLAESDDYADLRFLEELVPILDRNPNVGLAYCQSCIIDDQDRLLAPNFLECTDCFGVNRWHSNYLNEGKNECANFLAAKNTIPNASAVLIRKSIYESTVGRDNERFKVAGDWFSWNEMLLASDVYFVSESLNYFRSCEGSVSRNAAKIQIVVRESLLIFHRIKERVDISYQAQKVFFELVSNWWITYLVIGRVFDWGRELAAYQQIQSVSPAFDSLFSWHWQLLMVPINRFRYMMKLRMRLNRHIKTLENLLPAFICIKK